MKLYKTKEIVVAGLMITIGLILPAFFHIFGAGSVFLPMHIPVLISGFLLEMPYAFIIGAATPLLSSLITGMPPIFPIMPVMVIELGIYGIMVSMLYRRMKFNVYSSLIISMIIGRIAAGITVWIIAGFFAVKLPGPVLFVSGSIGTGLPGIILQLIFIPVIVSIFTRNGIIKRG